MPAGKVSLTHKQLVEKAHFQASLSPGSPHDSHSLSISMQESRLLSPQSSRILSPTSGISPLSPEGIRVFDSFAPEDSPTRHSIRAMGGYMARSPSAGALIARKSAPRTRNRSAGPDELSLADLRPSFEAEARLNELDSRLHTTKAALMASEKRVDDLLGGVDSIKPVGLRYNKAESRVLGSARLRNNRLAPELEAPGVSTSLVSTTASATIPEISAIDNTQLALTPMHLEREAREQDAACQMLQSPSKNELVLHEIKMNHAVHIAVEEARIKTRDATAEKCRSKEIASAKEIMALKEENAKLKGRVHELEQQLWARSTAHDHQSTLLKEVKEERHLKVNGLERELIAQQARMQEILHQLHQVKQAKAYSDQTNGTLDQHLCATTRELEFAGNDHSVAREAYETRLEQLGQECSAISKEAENAVRVERLQREKEVSAARAEAKGLQLKCRDEQRCTVLVEEQLDRERRDRAACEASTLQVKHLLTELMDQHTVDKHRSSSDLQKMEAVAQGTQQRLRSELEEVQLQAESLRMQLDERERQLQDMQDTVGGLTLVRDEANAKRMEALEDLRMSKALTADLQRALADSLREKEDCLRQSKMHLKNSEAQRDLFQQRAYVLKTALDEGRFS